MESLRDDVQRENLMRFFKTGPGEYGEGDEFLGLKVPQTREVVRLAGLGFPLPEIPELLMNRWHEVRLCGFLIPQLLQYHHRPIHVRLPKMPLHIHMPIGFKCNALTL